jgi:pilus assembly protein CpaB
MRFLVTWILALVFGGLLGCSGMQTAEDQADKEFSKHLQVQGLIPHGMRAVSVRVNDSISISGLVQPGARVDVMLTRNPHLSKEQQTTTVLENVAVIATGYRLERNSAGKAQSVRSMVTLLLSPGDAERLTLSSPKGHLQLVLRN